MSDSNIPHLVRSSAGVPNLAGAAGLERLSVEGVQVPPGTTYPLSATGETFVYVLVGRGLAHGQGETLNIAEGDFLSATLKRGESLSLENPNEETLVVLAGGESARYP